MRLVRNPKKHTVGYPLKTANYIDEPMLKRHNIRISNTPNVVNDATAEQAMALMLAAARNTILGWFQSCFHFSCKIFFQVFKWQ